MNLTKTRYISPIACLFCLLFLLSNSALLSQAQAPTSMAAMVEITFAQVNFTRVLTQQTFSLAPQAVMPVASGDIITTNNNGRAIVTFFTGAIAFILPESTFEIVEFYAGADGNYILEINQTGRVIYQFDSPEQFESFLINTHASQISAPSEMFAVDNAPNQEVMYAISTEGTLSVTDAQETLVELTAHHGIRIQEGIGETTPLSPQSSFAVIEGLLSECPGTVNAINNLRLNVRTGPLIDYTAVGSVPNNIDVNIIALSESRERYRIQFLSNYGWILTEAVLSTCDLSTLPVLPNSWMERNIGVLQPSERELTLLEPFYGTPQNDRWFYR